MNPYNSPIPELNRWSGVSARDGCCGCLHSCCFSWCFHGKYVFSSERTVQVICAHLLIFLGTSFLYPQCFIYVSLFKDAGVIGKYSLTTLLRKKTSLKKCQTVTFSSPQFNKSWRVFTWLLSWQCGTLLQSGFPPHHFSQIVLMRVFKMSSFPNKFRMDSLDPLWFHIHWNSA